MLRPWSRRAWALRRAPVRMWRERAPMWCCSATIFVRFVETLRMARRVRRTIWQNFAGTLAVDALGIVLAALGLLGPLLAAFIHVSSEMTFILNSARLLPRSSHKGDGTAV